MRGLGVDLAVLVVVFAVTVAVAELAGAANLGVALGVGQVAFAVALVVLLTRRASRTPPAPSARGRPGRRSR